MTTPKPDTTSPAGDGWQIPSATDLLTDDIGELRRLMQLALAEIEKLRAKNARLDEKNAYERLVHGQRELTYVEGLAGLRAGLSAANAELARLKEALATTDTGNVFDWWKQHGQLREELRSELIIDALAEVEKLRELLRRTRAGIVMRDGREGVLVRDIDAALATKTTQDGREET